MPMPTIIIVNKIRVRSNTSDGALWTINISMKMFHYRVLVTSHHVMLAPDSQMRSNIGLWLDGDWIIQCQCQSDNDHSSQCRDMTHVTRVILHGSRHCSHRISISENISLWNLVWYLCIWKAMCYPEKQSWDVRLACPGSVLWHLWLSGKTEHDPSRAGDNA